MKTTARDLVTEYAKIASSLTLSESESYAITEARRLSEIRLPEESRRDDFFPQQEDMLLPSGEEENPKIVAEVASWQRLILEEIYSAICKNHKKYKKEMAALKNNVRLLVGAITGYVAASIGATRAVIAALVAALLHFAFSIGISTFCKRFQAGLWPDLPK